MNATPKSRSRRFLLWPLAGIALAVLVAILPSKPRIPLELGIIAWFADMALVLLLSSHPVRARAAALGSGILLAVPSFVAASPLPRLLLACFMCVPIAAATALLVLPPAGGFRERIARLCAWSDAYPVERRSRRFDGASLSRLLIATAVLAAAIAVAKTALVSGIELAMRWIAGGIAVLAFAEMATCCQRFVMAALGVNVPPIFQSPHCSVTVSEFWARRWNVPATEGLKKFCFTPLARRGAAFALACTFALSALGHMLLALFALGKWTIAIMCGAFFLVQPLLLAAERRMNLRHWRPAPANVFTLGVLTLTSPLVVEPLLQIAERAWGAPSNVFLPTAAVLGFVIAVSCILPVAALASGAADSRAREAVQ